MIALVLGLLVGRARSWMQPARALFGRVPRAARLAPLIALGCAALLALGCSAPIPVHLAGARPDGLTDDEAVELVLEAGDYLPAPTEIVEGGYGAITLTLAEGGRVVGESQDELGCERAVWAEPRPRIIAHELAHALGVEHRDDADNLMRPRAPLGVHLDDDQIERALRSLGRLNACTARS